MKITKLEVNNFVGITEATIEPLKMTVISGKNGQGKTSLVEAIKAGFRGAGADKIKVGASKSEIFIKTDEIEVRRKITAAGSTVTIKKDGMTLSKPQAYLDGIIGDFSFEPVRFFAMEKKEQTAYLLKAIPVKATAEQLVKWTKGLYNNVEALVALHGLEAISTAAEALYNLRAGDNSRVKDLEANIEELKSRIPASASEFNPAEMEACMGALADAKADEQEQVRIKNDLSDCFAMEKELAVEKAECEKRIKARVQELATLKESSKRGFIDVTSYQKKRAEIAEALRLVDEDIAQAIRNNDQIRADVEKAEYLSRNVAELDEDMKDIVKRISSVTAKQEALEAKIDKEGVDIPFMEKKIEGFKIAMSYQRDFDRLEDLRKEWNAVSESAEARDKAVKTLQKEAPAELLLQAKMPVEGLAYSAGAFTLNGVPIQNLSTSEKARLAVAVTRQLNSGYAIKAICLDGFESLDTDTQKAFMEEAQKDDFQYFVTKVADTDMEVTTK